MDKGGFGGKYFLQQYENLNDGHYDDGMGGSVRVVGGKPTHYPKGEVPQKVLDGGEGGKYDTEETETRDSGGSGSGGSEVRESGGIVQKGMTLGGVNNFLGGLKIRSLGDMNELYSDTEKNTDLEGFALSDVDVEQGYDVSDGAYPGKRTAFNQTSTTPQTTSKPDSPQDGASAEPTVADQVRAVRVARGARQQEFAERPGNSKSSEPKNSGTNWGARTMADNSDMRTRIGSAFLSDDYDNTLQALRAAETEARVFKQGGKVFYNQGGELVEAKDNGKDFYRSAMRGINPMEFADKFAQDYIDEVKGGKVQPTRGTAPGTPLFEAARPGL